MNELGGLPDLYMWELICHGTGQAVRRKPQTVMEDSEAVLPMLLPSASSTLAVRVNHSANKELVMHTTDFVAVKVLAEVDRAAEAYGTPHVRFSQLSNCHMDQIIALAHDGALCLSEDDFGEVVISKNHDGTKYVNIQNVGKPLQVIKHDSYSPTSKLDLVLALLRHGWVAQASPEPFKPGAPKNFTSSRLRPTSYFYCLVTHAALFANGVRCIPHDAKDLYYQCLLRLRGNALSDFLERHSSGNADDHWSRQHLKDHGEKAMIEDAGDPVEPVLVNPDPEEAVLVHADLVPLEVPRVEAILGVLWKRAKVHLEGWPEHRVQFDNCSHASGKQRGYIFCQLPGHKNCLRYCECPTFASRHDFCAYLMAWVCCGKDSSNRKDHMSDEPSASSIEAVSAALHLQDY